MTLCTNICVQRLQSLNKSTSDKATVLVVMLYKGEVKERITFVLSEEKFLNHHHELKIVATAPGLYQFNLPAHIRDLGLASLV